MVPVYSGQNGQYIKNILLDEGINCCLQHKRGNYPIFEHYQVLYVEKPFVEKVNVILRNVLNENPLEDEPSEYFQHKALKTRSHAKWVIFLVYVLPALMAVLFSYFAKL